MRYLINTLQNKANNKFNNNQFKASKEKRNNTVLVIITKSMCSLS